MIFFSFIASISPIWRWMIFPPGATKIEYGNPPGHSESSAALKASFDFCADALSKMDDSKLGEMIAGMGPQPLSRARFALGIASNWADHYAEAAMYLRLNGILPPTAKK